MISKEKKPSISRQIFVFIAALLVSGTGAKIVYALYLFCGMPLVAAAAGPTVTVLLSALGFGLWIFSWIMCFRWLYAYFKKEFLGT